LYLLYSSKVSGGIAYLEGGAIHVGRYGNSEQVKHRGSDIHKPGILLTDRPVAEKNAGND